MSDFEREDRYIIFKRSDIERYLTQEERQYIREIGEYIDAGRIKDHKDFLRCVVIESDWPEYEPVWEMLEDRVASE